MAKQQVYDDATGTTHNNSYWRVGALSFDIKARVATFRFDGFHSKASANTGKATVGAFDLSVVGEEFDTEFATIIAKGKNPQEVGYAIAGRRAVFTPEAIDV